jgi:hypothetical protein
MIEPENLRFARDRAVRFAGHTIEKIRFDPCEIPKDGLTEGIVTRLATIAVV